MTHPRCAFGASPSRGLSLDMKGPGDLSCLAKGRAHWPGAACKAHLRTGGAGSAVFTGGCAAGAAQIGMRLTLLRYYDSHAR